MFLYFYIICVIVTIHLFIFKIVQRRDSMFVGFRKILFHIEFNRN